GLALVRSYGKFGIPREKFANVKLAVVAQKGKRDLFAKGDVVPGYSVELRTGLVLNVLSDSVQKGTGGFAALYLSVKGEQVRQKFAHATTPGRFQLLDETVSTGSVGLGVELAPSYRHAFGLLLTPQWSSGAPVAKSTQQVCVTRQVGVDGAGNPVVVSDCSDRFVGDRRDTRGLNARLDYIGPRWPSYAANPEDVQLTVSPLAAISLVTQEGDFPRYNVAVG